MEFAELIRTSNEILNGKIVGANIKDFLLDHRDNVPLIRKVLEQIISRNDRSLVNDIWNFLNEVVLFFDEEEQDLIEIELDALDPVYTQIKIAVLLYEKDPEIFEQELSTNVFDYNYHAYTSGFIDKDMYESIRDNNIRVVVDKIKDYGLDNNILTSNDLKTERSFVISMLKNSLPEKYYDEGLINYNMYKDVKEYINNNVSRLIMKK
jgi:hypothetical protein